MVNTLNPNPVQPLRKRNLYIIIGVVLLVAMVALVKSLTTHKPLFPTEAPEVSLQKFKDNRQPVLVYFHSPECLSCREVQGALDEVYPEFKDRIALLSLDVLDDSSEALVERTGVHTTPVLLFVDANGNETQFSGEISPADLRARLNALSGGTP